MKLPLFMLFGFTSALSFSQNFEYEGFYPQERIYDMDVATIFDLAACLDGYVHGEKKEKET